MSTFLEIVLPIAAFTLLGALVFLIIKKIFPLYSKADPENVDACLYVVIGSVVAWQAIMSGEESYKYVNPFVLYWMKSFLGVIGGGALALKSFRSGRKKPSSEKQQTTTTT